MYGVTVKFIPKDEKARLSWNLDSGGVVALVHGDEPIGKVWAAVDSIGKSKEAFAELTGWREPRRQGPLTRDGAILGHMSPPPYEKMKEISEALLHEKILDSAGDQSCMKAYMFGVMDGKRAERARKKAHDAEQGQS